jgi:hypothetical protein
MKPAPLEYQAPATLQEAIDLLASDPFPAIRGHPVTGQSA